MNWIGFRAPDTALASRQTQNLSGQASAFESVNYPQAGNGLSPRMASFVLLPRVTFPQA